MLQAPIWSLDMALNNETIVGQDLVAWVMCGIVHVPRSEVWQSPCRGVCTRFPFDNCAAILLAQACHWACYVAV